MALARESGAPGAKPLKAADVVVHKRLDIEAGIHVIELRHPLFAAARYEVEVKPGETEVVEHAFTRDEEDQP